MSVVGPRALRPDEPELGETTPTPLEDVPGFAERSSVRPGLTGLAQIYAPRDVRRRQKFRYDRLYIHRQSFGLDLRLIALSFWITARGTWEARGTRNSDSRRRDKKGYTVARDIAGAVSRTLTWSM